MSAEGYCPRTWHTESIIATVLFFPIGVWGLYYGKQTYKNYRHPDKYNEAVKCSKKAGNFAGVGILVGIVFWISMYMIFFM